MSATPRTQATAYSSGGPRDADPLAAYWAGAAGPRQPLNVEAFPAGQTARRARRNWRPEEAPNVKIYSQAAPAVANIVTRQLEYDVFLRSCRRQWSGLRFSVRCSRIHPDQPSLIAGAQQIESRWATARIYTARVVGSDERNDVALIPD